MTVVESSIATTELFNQLAPGLNAQTIGVIERHRSGQIVKGRGWLVRRALAAADMIGLSAAFIVAMVWWAGSPVDDRVSDMLEFAIFALSLPAWILAANLYGLYSSDEERTDHSTADDLVRRVPPRDGRQLGALPRRDVHRGRRSESPAPAHLLGALDHLHHVAAGAGARALSAHGRLPPEHGHRRRRGGRAARRAQAAPASRVRHERRRIRRCAAQGAPARARRPQPPRDARAPAASSSVPSRSNASSSHSRTTRTRRPSISSARSRTRTSRSTSFRGCSR